MSEFGVFNTEGLVEGQFYYREDAAVALRERYAEDEEAHVAEVCSDHADQERDYCEECDAEIEDDAEEDDE